MACKLTTNPRSPLFALSIPNPSPKPFNSPSISFFRKQGIGTLRITKQRRAPIAAVYAPPRSDETLYQLLGISETVSSISDIKKAYKEMARRYHPDVSPPDRIEENTKRFVMVREAYETLSNPARRALYDHDLALGLQSGFGFSPRKTQHYNQKMEERGEWRTKWQSQLEGLKRRSAVREGGRRTKS